jgi:hypothetical protein
LRGEYFSTGPKQAAGTLIATTPSISRRSGSRRR